MRRLTVIILLLIALAAMTVLSGAAAPGASGEIAILFTGDVAENSQDKIGYAGVSSLKESLEEDYGSGWVTLIDAGDSLGGHALDALSDGEYTAKLMELAGYDIAVPGRMEFAYGIGRLREISEMTSFAYLSCNFVDVETNMNVLPPYEIVSYGTENVGYIGITSPESFESMELQAASDQSVEEKYSLCQGDNGQTLYGKVQQVIDTVKMAGADYVVAVGNLGDTEDYWSAESIIENTSGIDVFINGHGEGADSGEISDKNGEGVLLAIYEGGLDSVGIVAIDTVKGTISAGTVDEWEDRDRSVTDGIEDLRDQYTRTYSGAIALAKADLVAGEAEDTDLVRSQETNLGDLCADAYRSETGADAAIVAGSCFCRGIAAGQITRDDVLGAVSETEVLFVAELSGQQILDILELGAAESPEPSDSFTQVSGLRYSIDTSIPSPVSFDEDSGEWTIEGERRIGGVEIGSEPLDANETYTVALSGSFIIEAIDGIDQGEEYTEADSTGGEALVRYIRDTLRGDLSGYQDPEGQDRIAFVNTEKVGDAGTAQQESVYYVVRIGDSLWGIAKRELGSGSRWVEIYETNRDSIASPELIYPGMELLMP